MLLRAYSSKTKSHDDIKMMLKWILKWIIKSLFNQSRFILISFWCYHDLFYLRILHSEERIQNFFLEFKYSLKNYQFCDINNNFLH